MDKEHILLIDRLLAAFTPAGHLAVVSLGFSNRDVYCLYINSFDGTDMNCYNCRVTRQYWPVV